MNTPLPVEEIEPQAFTVEFEHEPGVRNQVRPPEPDGRVADRPAAGWLSRGMDHFDSPLHD